jgi:hypothetical protein
VVAHDGRELFLTHCATCHGQTGTGSGPSAARLKQPPPDLTEITRRAGGIFPEARLKALIAAGVPRSSHGASEMAAWGPIFQALEAADAGGRNRTGALVAYLELIQTEITVVSGSIAHHRLTNDLFHIDGLWFRVPPGTELHRWFLQARPAPMAVILTANPERFGDGRDVRILNGTLIHELAPQTLPMTHSVLIRDQSTGGLSSVTLETTNLLIVRRLAVYDDEEVSVVFKILEVD